MAVGLILETRSLNLEAFFLTS